MEVDDRPRKRNKIKQEKKKTLILMFLSFPFAILLTNVLGPIFLSSRLYR